ncbi:hypothetical protein K470DRAFT_158777 [Piedraia hortae CBS 480.64]|uniref:Reverse transcriptase domain-containing protein n=1 Tax=Piedraia hortae CBS 480.64 TaxID=1314780 RepID=A0A6A7BS78_9PEZI|nr:hypothetical protein K470DRAFT_158777 [Piedraia hortae CBS 480.64]
MQHQKTLVLNLSMTMSVFAYLDDILIFTSGSLQDHRDGLSGLGASHTIQRMDQAGLRLNLAKRNSMLVIESGWIPPRLSPLKPRIHLKQSSRSAPFSASPTTTGNLFATIQSQHSTLRPSRRKMQSSNGQYTVRRPEIFLLLR